MFDRQSVINRTVLLVCQHAFISLLLFYRVYFSSFLSGSLWSDSNKLNLIWFWLKLCLYYDENRVILVICVIVIATPGMLYSDHVGLQ